MKENTTYITTATIRFYENIYLFPNSSEYAWIIKLEDCPLCGENNRIYMHLNSSYEHSLNMADAIRRYFASNYIFDGSKATIIFDSNDIVAIGMNGADYYLDVHDTLKAKSFYELGINITSLIVEN